MGRILVRFLGRLQLTGQGEVFNPISSVGLIFATSDGLSASSNGSTSTAGIGAGFAAGDGSFFGVGKSSDPINEDSSPGFESASGEGSNAPVTPLSVASKLSRWVFVASELSIAHVASALSVA